MTGLSASRAPSLGDSERDIALRLLSAAAVRERAHEMLGLAEQGALAEFRVDLDKLGPTADFVAKIVRQRYPDLAVPFHARWRHFVFGGRDLWAEIAAKHGFQDDASRARARFDLAITSVLLDAGAGAEWVYRDGETGLTYGRSEGLALASLRMFEQGLFSSDPADPLRADAARLTALDTASLARGFQVTAENPLVGLAGRLELLKALGAAALADAQNFASVERPRPGGLFDALAAHADAGRIGAPDILGLLLQALGPIWPGRHSLGGISLGDCWRHPVIKRTDASDSFVPFHKLSQWMAYSLAEPLEEAGYRVADVDGLTGLAEYRNGGLFIDSGIIVPQDAAQAAQPHTADDPFIVAWRALTVALLDRLAPLVRERLGVTAEKFPLACMLEGGTWAAGRVIAVERRPGGGPPLTIVADGTVF
jgi:hypothetical protein